MTDNFPATGKRFLVNFGAFRVELMFSSITSLTYTVVGDDGRPGQSETVSISVEQIGSALYLVTWQEADKTTVVHIENYNKNTIITNITNPDLSFQQFHGIFTEVSSPGATENNPKETQVQPPTYSHDIRPLFRDGDITCMKRKGVELGDSVWMCNLANAQRVYDQLSSGNMPPDTPWPQPNITLFKAWMDGGCNP